MPACGLREHRDPENSSLQRERTASMNWNSSRVRRAVGSRWRRPWTDRAGHVEVLEVEGLDRFGFWDVKQVMRVRNI